MAASTSLPASYSDRPSNKNELILHAAQTIGRSGQRLDIFKGVYYHKSRIKTVSQIAAMTGLDRLQVLKAARPLVTQHIIGQTELNGEIAYEQDPFLMSNKRQVLRLVGDPEAQKSYPTKRNPRVQATAVKIPGPPKTAFVTIDSIDSFHLAKETAPLKLKHPLPEQKFKEGLASILEEEGEFKDWGGEQNDLYSTRLKIGGKRLPSAIALKGPATKGKLKPKHMGANADQIQRLFKSPAEVFLVQHHDSIDESIIDQMSAFAMQKARESGKKVFYGIIDGRDSRRLMAAYPEAFKSKSN